MKSPVEPPGMPVPCAASSREVTHVLFGACERHNFGDLLMPHVLEALLPDAQVVVCGLRDADLTAVGGHQVRSLATARTLLGERPVNLIHFGGEILTCRAEEAFGMFLTGEEAQRFTALTKSHPGMAAGLARVALGLESPLAYVQGRAAFARVNRLVFHAAGMAHPQTLNGINRHLDDRLCSADFVGLRDSASLAYAQSIGLTPVPMPCGVTLIKELCGAKVAGLCDRGEVARCKARFASGYVALQLNTNLADDDGHLARQLRRFCERTGLGLILFAAGTASGHDDPALLRRWVGRFGGANADIMDSANIWEIVGLISQARLYLGSSLHGRIVAQAYGLPRFSLLHHDPKLLRYCALWELPGTKVGATLGEIACEDLEVCLQSDPAMLTAHATELSRRYREAWGKLANVLAAEPVAPAAGGSDPGTEFDRRSKALGAWMAGGMAEVELHAQLFADTGADYSEERSIRCSLVPGEWQTVRFTHLERLGDGPVRQLRFDPMNRHGLVEIESVKLLRESDRAVLYVADSVAALGQMRSVGGQPVESERSPFALLVLEADPQLYFPFVPEASLKDCVLEVVMRPELATDGMVRRTAEWARKGVILAAQIKQGREDLTMLTGHLQATKEALVQTRKAEAALSENLRAARQESAARADELAVSRDAVAAGEAETARLTHQLQVIGQELTQALTASREAQAKVDALTGTLRAAEAELAAVTTSASWRLTRHFRRWKRSYDKRRHWLGKVVPKSGRRTPTQTIEYLQASGHFDREWYLDRYPDVRAAGLDPVWHYVHAGARELRDPCPDFNTAAYCEAHPELHRRRINPFLHWLEHGGKPRPASHPRPTGPADRPPVAVQPSAGQVAAKPALDHGTVSPIRREPEFGDAPPAVDVRLLAFYLPQFHRIPENDAWWGEGFTEWTNVRRGSPQFSGHYQPHVPHADVGYYDLKEGAVMERQAALARRAGLHGFCFYHYWFDGKRLLEMPVERYLQSGRPDFPFCLCWANENWTRRWDGQESEILIGQHHSAESDHRFIHDVLPALADRRYVRMDGRPLLLIYRPLLLPDPKATFRRWREVCRAEGLGEIYIAGVQGMGFVDPRPLRLDGAVEFPPNDSHVTPLSHAAIKAAETFRGNAYDYLQARSNLLARDTSQFPVFRGVTPAWDNTARRQERGTVFLNSTPEDYYLWLREVVRETRERKHGDERVVFINAWNEWAEGCHLEPDERYGYAWLNATRRAVEQVPGTKPQPAPDIPLVVSPRKAAVDWPPLPVKPHLSVSVLFYYREEMVPPFLEALLPQARALVTGTHATCTLHLVLNYPATDAAVERMESLTASARGVPGLEIKVIANGLNLGFGAAHNAVFHAGASDVFLLLNSDVIIGSKQWLTQVLERFADPEVALVGLRGAASKLRADGCGLPLDKEEVEFDFVDGSAVAVRAEVARRFGLFDPAFAAFYFEDADLCLRLRQCGLKMELVDLPYEHQRSSSTKQLPRGVVERILDHNRARFFERWQPFLERRQLPDRLAVEFKELARDVQAAALPAIYGLLSSHPGATIEIVGLHPQLWPFYAHPRLRPLPAGAVVRPGDYHRHQTVDAGRLGLEPLPQAIASQMGCGLETAALRHHLAQLAVESAPRSSPTERNAVVIVARQSPLFHGREPEIRVQWTLAGHLRKRGFAVTIWTDCAGFELAGLDRDGLTIRSLSGPDAGRLLTDLAHAEVAVGPDHWVMHLAHWASRSVFGWFGATAPSRRWLAGERVGWYADPAVECLGCHHRWGGPGRSFCLRGDRGCMSSARVDEAIATLEAWLDGKPAAASHWFDWEQRLATWQRVRRSPDLDLSTWPDTQAGSVLVLIPTAPSLDRAVVRRAEELAKRATRGMRHCRVVLDAAGAAPPRGAHPVRQPALAAIRQGMIERHLRDEAWVFWVDADIVEYPATLLETLIERAEGGIAAPLVIMEGNSASGQVSPDGFGPGRFYDVGGFVEGERWARFEAPYFDQPGPVYDLDSVGSIYLVNADLYRQGARHEADPKSAAFNAAQGIWPPDAVRWGQTGPALAFTEHYSVCQFAKAQGLPVRAFADLVALHQRV